ncbi:response regulator [Roseibium salinum]|uniref:Response regulator n=1 Tax=Roseibium salinum TaxID=1604349 RepID=A0ABT3R336_9HYPH|nr:response regulator [Roseibium sp. DSM 29163]MCX2723615.1 response regulator [Roseibium sp. DSM 29163]
MNIHIIEDDEAVADALAVALEGLEHRPVTYPDGETFLARAELASEDWVIIDLGLPGISGVDVIRKIRHLPDPPRILAITGKPQARLLTHLKALPGLKILRKPLSIEMITKAMN